MMENEFKQILALLIKLNKNYPPRKSRSAPIQLENRRINDLVLLNKKAMVSINLLKKLRHSSVDEIMEQVCRLDVYMNTYVWHIESIRDIIEKRIMKDSKHD